MLGSVGEGGSAFRCMCVLFLDFFQILSSCRPWLFFLSCSPLERKSYRFRNYLRMLHIRQRTTWAEWTCLSVLSVLLRLVSCNSATLSFSTRRRRAHMFVRLGFVTAHTVWPRQFIDAMIPLISLSRQTHSDCRNTRSTPSLMLCQNDVSFITYAMHLSHFNYI